MVQTSGTPEWWEDVFNPHEISDLQRVTEEAVNHHDTIDTVYLAELMGVEYVDVELMVPASQLPSILKGLREAVQYTKVDADWQEFIHMLGATLAFQYLESDCEYDEYVSEIATWFLPGDDE